MKKNAIASLALAFATAFVLADNLGTPSLVGDLSSSSDYVYTADETDTLLGARVPATRKVNNKALSADVTLSAADVGAAAASALTSHTSDTTVHITAAERETWNAKASTDVATTRANGLMSSTDKSKLDGVAAGANLGFTGIAGTSGNITADATHTDIVFTGSNISVAASSGPPGAIVALSVPDGTTSAKGVVQLSSATNSSDATLAATPAAVKSALEGAKAYTDAKAYSHPAYTARTGKPTANAAPGFGGTFTISQVTSDGTGHVTALTDRTITIPSATASTTAAGLMSAADKTALDALASGGVTKSAVEAALTAQGITSADDIDTLNDTIAELKKVIAALEALR